MSWSGNNERERGKGEDGATGKVPSDTSATQIQQYCVGVAVHERDDEAQKGRDGSRAC